jgi:CRP-like cAMP-binding protein
VKPGVEVLQAVPLLSAFPRALLVELNNNADLARVGPGEILFQSGDRLIEFSILLSGCVATTHPHNGVEVLADVLEPVTPLGLAAALLDIPLVVGARTITAARLITIPAAELRAIVDAEPAAVMPFLHYALHTIQQLTQENCGLKLRSSAQRLAQYLLRLATDAEMSPARFVLPYEKQLLAGKIGCTKEHLARAFATLRSYGVETKSGIIVLGDVPRLRAFADLLSPSQPTPHASLRPEQRRPQRVQQAGSP